ncbi:hypothetical protein [Moraxella porci]|uniref:hypothetical protein n=1 Tax=Moraxella porci TaxID=1288392 RepID=UPI002446D034|nr:hypothetical protein [Moraxella porci]MDH2274067.1 hypothetical protein [Moraxella porci]
MINLQNQSIIDKKNFYKIVLFVLFCVAMGIFYKIFFHPKASISDTNSYIQESKVVHLQDMNMTYVSENLHSPYGYKLGTLEQYYYYQTVLYSPKMDKYFALRCYECFYPEYLYAPDLLSGIDDLEAVSTIMSNIHRPNLGNNKAIFLMVNTKEFDDNAMGTSQNPIPVFWYYQDANNKTQFVKHNPKIADAKPPYMLQKKFGSLYDAFGKNSATDNFQYFYNVFSYLTYHKSVD